MTKYLIKGTFEVEFDDELNSDWYYCRGIYEDFETFLTNKHDMFFFVLDYFSRFENHIISVDSVRRKPNND